MAERVSELLRRADALLGQFRATARALRKAAPPLQAKTVLAQRLRGHKLLAQLGELQSELRSREADAREQKRVERFLASLAEQSRLFHAAADRLEDEEAAAGPNSLTASLLSGAEVCDQFDLVAARQVDIAEIHAGAQRVRSGSEQLLGIVAAADEPLNAVLRVNEAHAQTAKRAGDELHRAVAAAPGVQRWLLGLAAVLLCLAALAVAPLLLARRAGL